MESKHIASAAFSLAAALLTLVVPGQSANQSDQTASKVDIPKQAVVVLSSTEGNNVEGVLVLKEEEGAVTIKGKVSGLEPGKHGFHIHEFGDLRDPAGKSAGDHFNPHGTRHGSPDDEQRHAGDLGNIEADDSGEATVDVKADDLQLHFVIGRSIVVHGDEDDFTSQPSGDAGERVALGVIGYAEVKQPDAQERAATTSRRP